MQCVAKVVQCEEHNPNALPKHLTLSLENLTSTTCVLCLPSNLTRALLWFFQEVCVSPLLLAPNSFIFKSINLIFGTCITYTRRAYTQVLFLRKAELGFFHFLEIVTGWLVPSAGQKIPVQLG